MKAFITNVKSPIVINRTGRVIRFTKGLINQFRKTKRTAKSANDFHVPITSNFPPKNGDDISLKFSLKNQNIRALKTIDSIIFLYIFMN